MLRQVVDPGRGEQMDPQQHTDRVSCSSARLSAWATPGTLCQDAELLSFERSSRLALEAQQQ